MHDDLGNHAEEEVLAKADSEAEACPVVSILQDFEGIPVEVNVAVEVHLVESLNGDLVLAMVLLLICRLLECEIVLNRSTGIFGLLVLSWTESRDSQPEGGEDRDEEHKAEENGGLETTPDPPRQPHRGAKEQGEEEDVGEGI